MPQFNARSEDPPDDLTISVIGPGIGTPGTLEFRWAGQLIDSPSLSKLQWAIFAILAVATKYADAGSPDAYTSSKRLANRLKEKNVVDAADPQNAISSVARLRGRIANLAIAGIYEMKGPTGPTDGFGHQVVLRDKHLGYRINIHPDNLELKFPR